MHCKRTGETEKNLTEEKKEKFAYEALVGALKT